MGGLSNAFWLWFPVLIYKAISKICKTLWKFNLWILQSISERPLYYCKPEYRLPGIGIGTSGNILIFFCLFILMLAGITPKDQHIHLADLVVSLVIMIGTGLGCLVVSRLLIRKGSI